MVMVNVMKLNINSSLFQLRHHENLRVIGEKLHSLWTCRFLPLKLTFPEKSDVCVCHSRYMWSSFLSLSTMAFKIVLTEPRLECFDRIS